MIKHKTARVAGNAAQQGSNRFVSARVLRTVARAMLPFYRKIALNRVYAARWGRAVVKADLAEMQRLLRLASPAFKNPLLGSNGIGYFVNFPFKGAITDYSSGTTIPPGSVQFLFETRPHQAVARAIVPLYEALASNAAFAQSLARAIRRGDNRAVNLMVRGVIKTKSLRSVLIEESGLALPFKFAFSKFTYEHLLFHEEHF